MTGPDRGKGGLQQNMHFESRYQYTQTNSNSF